MDRTLRVWNLVSLALLFAGMVWWLRAPGTDTAAGVLNGGLVLLMTMPVLKLFAVVGEEIRVRDWRFALLGLIVLVLLGGSVLLALRA